MGLGPLFYIYWGFRVKDLEIRMQGLGFKVQGSGFRGLGFQV